MSKKLAAAPASEGRGGERPARTAKNFGYEEMLSELEAIVVM